MDIPAPLVAIGTGLTVALLGGFIFWAVRTVRRANVVVTANTRLQETVNSQAACISALEKQVETLKATVDEQAKTIEKQQAELSELQTVIRKLVPTYTGGAA